MASQPKFENMNDLYTASVKRYASRPLFGTKVRGEWRWMSYGEFAKQTDAARTALASLGVQKGDVVAVIANNRPEWAVAAYATYGLGASYVPMYEQQHAEEWKYILADCGAKLVFVANDKIRDLILGLKSDLPKLKHVVVMGGTAKGDDALAWEGLLAKGEKRDAPIAKIDDPKTVAGFIYTSGTTGNPKGVLLSHGNIARNVSAIHEVFPMSEEDRSLSVLPWAHSFGQVAELHALISMGASIGLAESREKIIENLGEVQPTLFFSVPLIFNRIYDGLQKRMATEKPLKKRLFFTALDNEEQRKKLATSGRTSGFRDFKHKVFDRLVFEKVRARFGGRLKYAFSGGAAISREVAEFIDNLGITVYEGYGLTETSPIATANWPGGRKIGSVGRAIPGVRIEIDKVVTGDEKNGEIIVHGHNVMLGYHALPEENAKVFTPDGGFRTGDMGYLDSEGFLYITGRIKEQYKLENGKYVSPAPLEEHLKLSPFIANVMVYGDNKPFNVALIVADMNAVASWAKENGVTGEGEKLLADPKVKKLFEEELEKHSGEFKQFEKVRKFVAITDDFTTQNDMLTPSLKVKRRVVVKTYGDRLKSLYE